MKTSFRFELTYLENTGTWFLKGYDLIGDNWVQRDSMVEFSRLVRALEAIKDYSELS